MFAALARVRPIGLSRVEMPAGHLTAANCAIFGRKQGNRNVTSFLARTLSWAEVANGTSIVFDLRITALDGEAEAETQGRFIAEAIRLSEHFFWNRVSVSRRRDGQQYERSTRKNAKRERKIEPRQCAGPLGFAK
jgi:hypothetical protein